VKKIYVSELNIQPDLVPVHRAFVFVLKPVMFLSVYFTNHHIAPFPHFHCRSVHHGGRKIWNEANL